MKKSYIILFFVLMGVLAGCSSSKLNTKSQDNISEKKKYHRIVLTSSSIYPEMLAIKEARKNVIAGSPWYTANSNKNLVETMIPSSKDIKTDWINKDYKVNPETLESMNPDLIFYYGDYQNDNLGRFNVKSINLDPGEKDKYDPEKLQVFWEKTIDHTLKLKYEHKYADAWKETKDILKKKKGSIKSGSKLRALYIWQNLKDVKISTNNSPQGKMLDMAGIDNVSKGVKATGDSTRGVSVNSEQIIKWNPDIIIVCNGDTKNILNNSDSNSFWNNIEAVKKRRVYASPIGTFNWGSVASDTPLMPLWLFSKAYPESLTDSELKDITVKFYKKMYDFDLGKHKNLLDSIFQDR